MEYSAFENIIVRTPLHSIVELQKLNPENNLTELISFFEQGINKEALYLASPDLYFSFVSFQNGKLRSQQDINSLVVSLMKYMIRMSTRATPFGLFAGCSIGNVGKENIFNISTDLQGAKHTRLDMNYVCMLAKEISENIEIRGKLDYYANTSLYELGNKLRYIERKYDNTQVSYFISEIDSDDIIKKIIKLSSNGSKIDILAKALVNSEISYEEAEDFIIELINNQVIVGELEPSMCGEEYYETLIRILKGLNSEIIFELNQKSWNVGLFVERLQHIKNLLNEIDKKEWNSIAAYEEIIELLKEFGIKFELNRLFQTDLIKKSHKITINSETLTEIKKSLKVINKLSIISENLRLNEFAKLFYERYEEKEMPFLQVLDTEFGIGYPKASYNKSEDFLNNTELFLLEKITKAIELQSKEIEIIDSDLNDFVENWDAIPDTLSCMFQLINKDNKTYLSLSGAGGSSAANLLGRFCHADTRIEDIVKEIIKKEDELLQEDTILAEINHLTESRTGNIVSRPILRKYEIPFLAKSNLKEEFRLNLSDLMISVRANNIILRSKKTNKIVIPRLTNAHNFNYGISTQPIYQFLGDYQNVQGQSGIHFSWGKLEQMFSFFPRVIYHGHILSKAKWNFKKSQISDLIKRASQDQNEALINWRNLFKIPEKIILSEGDNELLIDFKNPLAVSIFLTTIKKKEHLLLEEVLFEEYSSPVIDTKNNQYLNQFLVFFHRNHPKINRIYPLNKSSKISYAKAKREFLPGDEWIYFKIYCGNKTANSLLTNLINPFTKEMLEKGAIEKWFFIRYADPDTHIRLRMYTKDLNKIGELISLFYQRAQFFYNDEQIRKIVIDTYSRELERYGSNTIEIVESLFYYNSDYVTRIVSIVDSFSLKWFSSLRYIDRFLTLLECNLEQKKELFEGLSEGFGREFNKDINLKKKLGNQFRTERNQISQIINGDAFELEEYAITSQIIEYSILQSKNSIKDLLMRKNELEVPFFDLLGSILHMFLNRIFSENQRYHEMVLYHMMWHHYRSEFAQLKIGTHEFSQHY